MEKKSHTKRLDYTDSYKRASIGGTEIYTKKRKLKDDKEAAIIGTVLLLAIIIALYIQLENVAAWLDSVMFI